MVLVKLFPYSSSVGNKGGCSEMMMSDIYALKFGIFVFKYRYLLLLHGAPPETWAGVVILPERLRYNDLIYLLGILYISWDILSQP